MTTLVEVAEAAGVSASIASRVLNDDPSLRARDDTRARVVEAADRLGYIPNHSARSLRLSRAGAIGLLVTELSNPIAAQMIQGMESAVANTDLHVLLGRAEWLSGNGDLGRSLIRQGRVDGLLIQLAVTADTTLAERILTSGIPVVLLNGRYPVPGSVALDDEGAGRVAAAHLVALGHRRIAVISGPEGAYLSLQRDAGIRSAVPDEHVLRFVHRPFTPDDGHRAMVHLLTTGESRPTGVVVANVNAALGALRAAVELGVAVPTELSIVAIQDSEIASLVSPGITTVRLPLGALGARGVGELQRRMSGQPARDVLISDPAPEVIVRGSTAPPA